MNMKSAEQWEREIDHDINEAEPLKTLIRQIQADALRWAASKARSYSPVAATNFDAVLDEQANQLDPVQIGGDAN